MIAQYARLRIVSISTVVAFHPITAAALSAFDIGPLTRRRSNILDWTLQDKMHPASFTPCNPEMI